MGGGPNFRGDPSVNVGFVVSGTALVGVGVTGTVPNYFKIPVLLPSSYTPGCVVPQPPYTPYPSYGQPGCNPFGAGPGFPTYLVPQIPSFPISGGNILIVAAPTGSVFIPGSVYSLGSLGLGLEVDPGNVSSLVTTATNAANLESLGLITGTYPAFSVAAGFVLQVTEFAN
jgi:hypothetical protein